MAQTSSVPMPSKSSSSKSSPSQDSSSNAPEITILTRVTSIPLIAWTMTQVSSTLEKNRYTSSPYATAKGISTTAYKYTEPLQVRFAPAINVVDGYANKACDVVESRFPYPFKAQPEEVATFVRERRQSAAEFVEQRRLDAGNTIDKRVRTPAFNAACEVDKRFTPLVDYLENTAVTRLHTNAPEGTQYQYQRVYVLSRNVTGQLYEYSNQTVLVQRASQTADSIVALASSANSHVNSMSNTLITQVQQLQTSLSDTTTAAYRELGDSVSSMRDIINQPNRTLNEKLNRMVEEIDHRLRPLLNRLPGGAGTTAEGKPNGNANANGNGRAQQ
ncbi:hypothetical protein R3P38DRAFT_2952697 [Favolaschia claudopus]|uniref:Lipid droplet-associated perilipin protein n=1 Tax=Favolaschia claudopus TaxID=2862362 RepID=A0AAW0BGX8_9AGAR